MVCVALHDRMRRFVQRPEAINNRARDVHNGAAVHSKRALAQAVEEAIASVLQTSS